MTDLRLAGNTPGVGQRKGLTIASLLIGILPILALFRALDLYTVVGVSILPIARAMSLLAIALGITVRVKAHKSPAEHGGKGLALGAIVTGILSLLSANSIPALVRSQFEGPIGDIRSIVSAEAAYQSANGGYYDGLECLHTPTRCIPDYPPTASRFIDVALTNKLKGGYRRTFHAGPPASPRGARVSPSSVRSFAYVAVPETEGWTGIRAYCGDASGVIRYTPDGREPEVVNAMCAASLPRLE